MQYKAILNRIVKATNEAFPDELDQEYIEWENDKETDSTYTAIGHLRNKTLIIEVDKRTKKTTWRVLIK